MMSVLTVAGKEFLSRLRSEAPHPTLAIVVGVLGSAALLALWLASAFSPQPPPSIIGMTTFSAFSKNFWRDALSANRDVAVFFVLSMGLVAFAAIMSPLYATGSLNGDQNRRSVEGLLLTGLSSSSIVLGKLLAALARTLFVLAAALPVFAAAWLFGGIAPTAVAATALVVITIALLGSAIAGFMSSILRGGLAGVIYTYLALALITTAIPVLSTVVVALGKPTFLLAALYLNPAIGLLSAHTQLLATIQTQIPLPYRDFAILAAQTWHGVPNSYVLLAVTAVGYLAAAGLFAILSCVLIDPFHPLRAFRPRLALQRRRR